MTFGPCPWDPLPFSALVTAGYGGQVGGRVSTTFVTPVPHAVQTSRSDMHADRRCTSRYDHRHQQSHPPLRRGLPQ
jgi:hypothetical protein